MLFPRSLPVIALAVLAVLAGCGGPSGPPPRCRNVVQNPGWENRAAGWNVPPFAKLEEAPAGGVPSMVIEGHADGAIAQMVPKSQDLAGLGVVAVGYARVETTAPLEPTDDDVTARLWEGTVALANGFFRRWGGNESPHAVVRFTGREAVSGAWKRFVAPPIAVDRARTLYPHFAFWGVRLAPGVKLRVAALSLVVSPEQGVEEPEAWVACPALAAPQPVLVSVTRRQFDEDWEPNGSFDESFGLWERAVGEPGRRELVLTARYRQGSRPADRFLVAVTDDGSDPRLSATSQVQTLPARQGGEQWQTAVRVRAGARPVRIAVAAAARTSGGLRAQTPLLPEAWQKP